jgi:hypothetical protein
MPSPPTILPAVRVSDLICSARRSIGIARRVRCVRQFGIVGRPPDGAVVGSRRGAGERHGGLPSSAWVVVGEKAFTLDMLGIVP